MNHVIDQKIVNVAIKKDEPIKTIETKKRPISLNGTTYKIRDGNRNCSVYLTVNYLDGKPFEVFLITNDSGVNEWVTALSLLTSKMLQQGVSLEDVAKTLCKVHSPNGYFIGGKDGFVTGTVHHIGKTLLNISKNKQEDIVQETSVEIKTNTNLICPECKSPSVIKIDGCLNCQSCGWSKCD